MSQSIIKTVAVIVAGGSGLRMGQSRKKQFLCVDGVPILCRTLQKFTASSLVDEVVAVAPADELAWLARELLPEHGLSGLVKLVGGGKTRQESVKNGLEACPEGTGLVLIHDGVRPFVTQGQIAACVESAQKHGACLLATRAADTLKQAAGNLVEKTLDREGVWLAQTPQAFAYELITQAHRQAAEQGFDGTDDASLVERMGLPVALVEGGVINIKITTPQDLPLAEALARMEADQGGHPS